MNAKAKKGDKAKRGTPLGYRSFQQNRKRKAGHCWDTASFSGKPVAGGGMIQRAVGCPGGIGLCQNVISIYAQPLENSFAVTSAAAKSSARRKIFGFL